MHCGFYFAIYYHKMTKNNKYKETIVIAYQILTYAGLILSCENSIDKVTNLIYTTGEGRLQPGFKRCLKGAG